MAVINNPIAIAFINERVRPIAELARALDAQINSCRVAYDAFYGTYFFGHDADTISDPSHPAAPALTAADILAFVALVPYNVKAVLDVAGQRAVLEKLCVRPLQAG